MGSHPIQPSMQILVLTPHTPRCKDAEQLDSLKCGFGVFFFSATAQKPPHTRRQAASPVCLEVSSWALSPGPSSAHPSMSQCLFLLLESCNSQIDLGSLSHLRPHSP